MVSFPLPGQFKPRNLDQDIARLAGARPWLTVSLVRNQAWKRGAACPVTGLPGWSNTRAAAAYGETLDGRLISFASGEPRIVPGRGQLIEGARTNLATYSSDWTDSSWSNSNVTVTAAAATAPDGTLTATKLSPTTSTSINMVKNVGAVAATAASYSIYVKKGSGATDANKFIMRNLTTATILVNGTLNYDTGVWTTTTGNAALVSMLADGWYRITLYASSGITSGDSIQIYTGFTGSSETAGEYAYFWGAQLEATAFPSSYIPTTTASATRPADVPVLDLLNPGWYDVSSQPELVTNGGFDADANWTKGTGWTISGGKATKTAGVQASASQNVGLSSGKLYMVSVTVSGITGGSVRFLLGGGGTGVSASYNANGTYTACVRADSGGAYVYLQGDSSFAGSVDNVSVKEVPADQVLDYPCTIWAEFERVVDTGSSEDFLDLRATDNNNRVRVGVSNSDLAFVQVNQGGADQGTASVPGTLALATPYTLAARVNTNSIQCANRSALGTEDTTATLPTSPTEIRLGQGNTPCGYLRGFSIIKGVRPDANLTRLAA